MLDTFQKNLCSISSEIQLLQQQSVNMNVKLKNRQSVRSDLSQFIDEMLVPEAMIKSVPTEMIDSELILFDFTRLLIYLYILKQSR